MLGGCSSIQAEDARAQLVGEAATSIHPWALPSLFGPGAHQGTAKESHANIYGVFLKRMASKEGALSRLI